MKEKLIGTWQLVDTRLFTADGVEKTDPFAKGNGIIIYCPNNIVAALVMQDKHKSFSGDCTFDAEPSLFEQMFKSHFSYCGHYSIEDDIVSHHLTISQ